MKNFKLGLSFLIFLIFTACALSGCDGQSTPPDNPDGKDRPIISISARDFSIFFDGMENGSITLADGTEYREGQLLPVFSALSSLLSVDFSESSDGGDIVFGDAGELSSSGAFGEFLALSEYLDAMPRLAAFLEENPKIRLSVSADEEGKFYTVPYLSGSGYRSVPLFNADAVRALLDGAGEFASESTAAVTAAFYTPSMPTSGTVDVGIMSGGRASQLSKNYDAMGNIIDYMNYRISRAPLSAVEAVNMLRNYIDDAYSGFYGERRSDLFLGESAAWDADELVALLRCAVALDGELGGIFVSEEESLVELAGMLFAVPGLVSYNYLYSGEDGSICDARLDIGSYNAVLRMKAIIREGLVTDSSDSCTLSFGTGCATDAFATALPPVSFKDGGYTRIIGDGAQIENYAVAVRASLLEDEEKLDAVLGFIDYLFSDEGRMLSGYGTTAFYTVDGERVLPSEAALSDAKEYSGGDLSRFMREYVGAGILFPYGNLEILAKEGRKEPIESAIELSLVEKVGIVTDDGIYLPPTPIRMYTKEEHALCDSNSYRSKYSEIFVEVLDGRREITSIDAAEDLLDEIISEASYSDYLGLKQAEAERYLRCYKRITK